MKLNTLNLLTIIFIILKLTNVIDWNWFIIISPFILNAILFIWGLWYVLYKSLLEEKKQESKSDFNIKIRDMMEKANK